MKKMIEILNNSKSDSYKQLKEKITGNYFPWYHNNNVSREEFNTDNVSYFGHTLYTRPEVSGYSQPASENFQLAFKVMQEILTENNYDSSKYFLLRMNANCVLPCNDAEFSSPHVDHDVPHLNFLLYLTNNGGSTFIKGQEHKPVEDQAILFSGEHFIQLPKSGRRIVLVATIMLHD